MELTPTQYYGKITDKLKEYLLSKGYTESGIRTDKEHIALTYTEVRDQVAELYIVFPYILYDLTKHAGPRIVMPDNKEYEYSEKSKPEITRNLRETIKESLFKRHANKTKNVSLYLVELNEDELSIQLISDAIGTVRTFFDKVISTSEIKSDEQLFYRGHADAQTYLLRPSIYRQLSENDAEPAVLKEHILFKEAIRRCPDDFERYRTTFEQLVKMQHYHLPTRLMDITTNPLVALYFACSEHKEKDGEIYVFTVKKEEIKYYDSDAVSVVANLARRPADFTMPPYRNKVSVFNEYEPIRYLLHEIKYEKPHFMNVIDPDDLERVFCVLPKLNNPRILRQSGAFFIFGIDGDKTRMAKFTFPFRRYTISAKGKKRILEDLEKLGIDESTLFPELETVADHLKHAKM